MTFLNDLFNETTDTALASHTPDIGGAWAKHPNFATGATVNAANDWVAGDSTTGTSIYYNSATPPSADYSVTAVISMASATTPHPGVAGRMQTGASTFYHFYHTGVAWTLDKIVAGTTTNLLSPANTPTLNTDYTIELSMVGTTISAKVNGSHITGSPVTDSSISAAGFAGLRCRQDGKIKSISAVNLGEASVTVTGTTALPAFSGGASTGDASATVTATTALPSFSGSATGTSSGVLTLPVLQNNTGTVLANETGATVHVYAVSTGNKVVTKTGQTTNASGVMTVTDALIVGGTQYRVVVVLGSGAEGLDKVTAT